MVESRGLRKQNSHNSSRTSSVISLDPLNLDGSDPLSHFAKIDSFDVDPLTKIASEYVSNWCVNYFIAINGIYFQFRESTKIEKLVITLTVRPMICGAQKEHQSSQNTQLLKD